MTRTPPRLSIAIPLYNEAAGLPELLRRLRAVIDDIPGGPHEMVFVDDGSGDDTLAVLESAAAGDDRVVVISLSRNFGHQSALTAALDHVTGDVTIVMDGDLQDPPEIIPRLLEHHANGFDVVYAQRASRREGWWLRACYFVFYRIFSRLSNIRVPLDSGDFGLLSRRVVEHLRRTREQHRFLRGLRSWVGFRQIGIPIDRDERRTGRSKYSMRKLFGLAFDGLFAFSIVPIRAAVLVGTIAICLSLLFAAYALYARLFLQESPRGFTALTLLITFLSGIHLFFLGVIGEYVGRVYEETKGRPLYIVSKVVRGSATGHAHRIPAVYGVRRTPASSAAPVRR